MTLAFGGQNVFDTFSDRSDLLASALGVPYSQFTLLGVPGPGRRCADVCSRIVGAGGGVSVAGSVVTVTATDAGGSNRTATQTFTVTVAQDADGDGLIGIHTPAQLDAVRHDLDGDGRCADHGGSSGPCGGVRGDGGHASRGRMRRAGCRGSGQVGGLVGDNRREVTASMPRSGIGRCRDGRPGRSDGASRPGDGDTDASGVAAAPADYADL